jgi:hypothetical protein
MNDLTRYTVVVHYLDRSRPHTATYIVRAASTRDARAKVRREFERTHPHQVIAAMRSTWRTPEHTLRRQDSQLAY